MEGAGLPAEVGGAGGVECGFIRAEGAGLKVEVWGGKGAGFWFEWGEWAGLKAEVEVEGKGAGLAPEVERSQWMGEWPKPEVMGFMNEWILRVVLGGGRGGTSGGSGRGG